MPDTTVAAVVMAGGLGTRMRSAVPKHFHPILGRRMVDWVIEAGHGAGASPLVVVASPPARDEFGASGVPSPCRSSHSVPATRCVPRRPPCPVTKETCWCSPAIHRS